MKVFFSCTTYNFEQYRSNYFAIRDYIADSGHVLTHDWIQKLRNFGEKQIPGVGKDEYGKAVRGIEEADALVFESTLSSFSTGHLLTLGLQLKKPILVMWLDSSSWVGRKGFIESIEGENLELTSYNMSNYSLVLSSFLNKYETYGTKHRFNLVLDEQEWQYLEWLNYRSFKTRTKILRELITTNLLEDEEYRDYLSKKKLKKTL